MHLNGSEKLFFYLYLSTPFQVAERAHMLWNNEHILNLIRHNRQVIFPLILPALEQNSRNHWNQTVLNLTKNTRKMLLEMDEELVLACEHKLKKTPSQMRQPRRGT